jgi:uncharacterized protein YndB with AHSA1/START domain
MKNATFVYVTYIASTPEKVWRALLDGEATRKYWGHFNVSDWKPGSGWRHEQDNAERTLRMVGTVVEVNEPKRLVFTWAPPADANDESKHSRVTFELEPNGDTVKLTVTHSELEPGSNMFNGISKGWPHVLSGLKTYIETGKTLAKWW